MLARIAWILLCAAPVSAPAEDWKSKPDAFWRERLTVEQIRVCRGAGTERAFSGEYDKHKGLGVYRCSSCGQPLFYSKHKFDSGTGWPSFWEPALASSVTLHDDDSAFMHRTEVRCARCGAHLGHVFDDGPPPTGKRYCMNSVCLKFETESPPVKQEKQKK